MSLPTDYLGVLRAVVRERSTRTITAIVTEPITAALGARVRGLDLARELPHAAMREIHAALLRFGVLFFRDQELSPEQQLAFARRLGPIHLHPHVRGLPQLPEVMEILKTETDEHNFGEGWHTDQMFLPEPAMATVLYAREIPEVGGDTLFACMRGAYRSLSPGLQRMVRRLRTVNQPDAGRRLRGGMAAYAGFGVMSTGAASGGAEQEMEHPLVRTHPETGEDVLYVGLHTERLAGFTRAESRPIVDYLMAHATRPENTCRFRWRIGSLAVWDNRRVLHNALNDYPGRRRRMHRVTIAGDRPVLREAADAGGSAPP